MAIIIDSDEALAEANANVDANVTVESSTNIQVEYIFTTGIFRTNSKQFLDQVNTVYREKMSRIKRENPEMAKTVYPVYMTDNLYDDPRMVEFRDYVGRTAWEVLANQGFDMQKYNLVFMDMFGQEHYKFSGHDTHTHPGSHITGFYFLEVPENSCRVVFQDPRQSKYHASLAQRDMNQVTLASNEINYVPQVGDFFFTNSWLPHAFTRNANVKSMKFIHFSLAATWA